MRAKPGTFRAYVEVLVRDPDGRCTYYRRYRSRSFVRNFLRMYMGYGSPGLAVLSWQATNTNGTAINAGTTAQNQSHVPSAGHGHLGIGSDGTAASVTDYALGAAISTGVIDTLTDLSAGGTTSYRWQKTFTNASGVTWTVREVALFTNNNVTYGGSPNNQFMLARDVLVSDVMVNNGQAMTVRYTLETTV